MSLRREGGRWLQPFAFRPLPCPPPRLTVRGKTNIFPFSYFLFSDFSV